MLPRASTDSSVWLHSMLRPSIPFLIALTGFTLACSPHLSGDARVHDRDGASIDTCVIHSGRDSCALDSLDSLTCPPALFPCGTACVDLTTDNSHCGSCSNHCEALFTCQGGECRGPEPCGGLICAGACIDQESDNRNCGGCGVLCDVATGHACIHGKCLCAGDTNDCAGVCVLLSTDPTNCGTCAKTCDIGAGELCVDGACTVDAADGGPQDR